MGLSKNQYKLQYTIGERMLNRMISITPIKMIMIFSVWSVAKSNIQVIKADGSLVEQLSTNPTDVQNNDPNQKLFWAHGHQSRPSVGEFDVELSTSSPKEILEIDKKRKRRSVQRRTK